MTSSGSYFGFGGMLLLLGAIGEWILGKFQAQGIDILLDKRLVLTERN